jgi:hypothetical protein
MEHNLLFGYYPLPKPQAGIELKDQRKPVKLAVKRIVHSKLCGTAFIRRVTKLSKFSINQMMRES